MAQRYFIVNHKYEDENIDLEKEASFFYRNKYVSIHYEYGCPWHSDSKVTNNLIFFNGISKGDVMFLVLQKGKEKNIYGFGYVVSPRVFDDIDTVELDFDKIIGQENKYTDERKEYSENYIKDIYNGIVYFKDKYFYSNLSSKDEKNYWPQRVDVDEYIRNNILNYSEYITKYDKTGNKQTSIFEIDKEKALRIAKAITGDDNFQFKKNNEREKMQNYIDILKQKKQIILQGAPGTGKTYSTAEIAVNLIDEKISDDRKEVMKRYNELIKKNRIFFTTFHQSMDYEEFVEGYKPISNDGSISYEITDGVFKEACKYSITAGNDKNNIEDVWNEFQNNLIEENIRFDEKSNNIGKLTLKTKTGLDFYLSTDDNGYIRYKPASQVGDNWIYIKAALFGIYYKKYKSYESYRSYVDPLIEYLKENYNLSEPIENNENPVVLIIDEINRGNIAKIFGELITLLEADKRKNADNEIEVKLLYSKEAFSVPQNLYIIGTMNTTDRSIGYIDYALRRRFAFITMSADRSKIENFYNDKNYDCKDNALNLFDKIKANIINDKNLNEEFEIDDIMIGHSYFMAENEYELKRKLEYEIKPLLLEYYKDGILKNDSSIKKAIKDLAI